MTIPSIRPAPDTEAPTAIESRAVFYLGWFLIFAVVAPPVAIILWRLATMPWG